MGLDIYLYRYDNFDVTQEREKKIEAFEEEAWQGKKYEDMSETERDAVFHKVEAFRRNLVSTTDTISAEDRLTKTNRKIQVDGVEPKEVKPIDEEAELYCREEIRKPSELHPDHYFKIGYFRSSYNDGGINSVLGKVIDVTLYSLFEPEENAYYVKPDWEQVKKRTRRAIEKLIQCIAEGNDYNCFKVNPTNLFGSEPTDRVLSEQEAIALLVKEKKECSGGFSSFANRHGEFFLNAPIQVSAVIKGRDTLFNKQGTPCIYIVYRNADGLGWYVQALEIIEETCDYVLQQPDKDKYYLHWSG